MQGSPGGGRRQPSVVVLGPVSLVEGTVLGRLGGGWIHAEGVGGICLTQERAMRILRRKYQDHRPLFLLKKVVRIVNSLDPAKNCFLTIEVVGIRIAYLYARAFFFYGHSGPWWWCMGMCC